MNQELDPITIARLVEVQKHELTVRQQELDLHARQDETRRLEIENNAGYALKSLEAQERDLQDQREKYNQMLKTRYWFITMVAIVTCVFCSYAIYAGAKEVIADAIKIILAFAAGGVGGYQFGKNRQST